MSFVRPGRKTELVDYLPLLPHLCSWRSPSGKIKGHGSLRDNFGVKLANLSQAGPQDPKDPKSQKGLQFPKQGRFYALKMSMFAAIGSPKNKIEAH